MVLQPGTPIKLINLLNPAGTDSCNMLKLKKMPMLVDVSMCACDAHMRQTEKFVCETLCVCVCVCVYVYIYIIIYTHTHTHRNIVSFRVSC